VLKIDTNMLFLNSFIRQENLSNNAWPNTEQRVVHWKIIYLSTTLSVADSFFTCRQTETYAHVLSFIYMFCDRCLSSFFWPLHYLSFFDIRILITLWYLQTLLLLRYRLYDLFRKYMPHNLSCQPNINILIHIYGKCVIAKHPQYKSCQHCTYYLDQAMYML
jgi:hypothetical protein